MDIGNLVLDGAEILAKIDILHKIQIWLYHGVYIHIIIYICN